MPKADIGGLIYLKNFGIFLEDSDLRLWKIIANTMPNYRTPLELIPKVSRNGNYLVIGKDLVGKLLDFLRQVFVENKAQGEVHEFSSAHVSPQCVGNRPQLVAQFLLKFFAHVVFICLVPVKDINDVEQAVDDAIDRPAGL